MFAFKSLYLSIIALKRITKSLKREDNFCVEQQQSGMFLVENKMEYLLLNKNYQFKGSILDFLS